MRRWMPNKSNSINPRWFTWMKSTRSFAPAIPFRFRQPDNQSTLSSVSLLATIGLLDRYPAHNVVIIPNMLNKLDGFVPTCAAIPGLLIPFFLFKQRQVVFNLHPLVRVGVIFFCQHSGIVKMAKTYIVGSQCKPAAVGFRNAFRYPLEHLFEI